MKNKKYRHRFTFSSIYKWLHLQILENELQILENELQILENELQILRNDLLVFRNVHASLILINQLQLLEIIF